MTETRPSITFTEADIIENRNILARIDGRMLPRTGKGVQKRTGKCACGKRCWPYASCGDCRGKRSIARTLKTLEQQGAVERVVDGRGRKGGAVWQLTAAERARLEAVEAAVARKASEVPQPRASKVGRNEPCPCGSGRKYKKCCLNHP